MCICDEVVATLLPGRVQLLSLLLSPVTCGPRSPKCRCLQANGCNLALATLRLAGSADTGGFWSDCDVQRGMWLPQFGASALVKMMNQSLVAWSRVFHAQRIFKRCAQTALTTSVQQSLCGRAAFKPRRIC